jgi:hypothetical protein
MSVSAQIRGGTDILGWESEHRDSICSVCSTPLEQDPQIPEETKKDHNYCPNCKDYRPGRLICRQVMVESPAIRCAKLSCLWQYTIKSIQYVLTLLYHQYRVEYAEKARGKEIPEHYRTGENVPQSILGLIWAIMRMPGG